MPRNSQPLEDFIPSAAECGASLSLIDDDGRLLFALAGTKFDCPPGELFYMGIGGHRLSCEDFPTCARREALEEIGADVHLVDCGETWLITADGVESRLELADQPRPFALYLMANSVHTDDSQRTYYIAIYQATLLDPTFSLETEEVRAVIALTPDQVVRGLCRRPTLGELIEEGAGVIASIGEIDEDVRVYPIGSAQALASVLRDTRADHRFRQ